MVTGITQLHETSITYIMHSCDYTGGAYFRSTNEEEDHAFYDPGTS